MSGTKQYAEATYLTAALLVAIINVPAIYRSIGNVLAVHLSIASSPSPPLRHFALWIIPDQGILLWFLDVRCGTASTAAATAASTAAATAADTAAATTAYSSRNAEEPLSNSGGPSNPSPWSYFYPFPQSPFPGSSAALPYFGGCEPQYKVNQGKFGGASPSEYGYDIREGAFLKYAHETFQDWCFGSLQNLHTSEDVEHFLEELGTLGYKKTAEMYEVALTRVHTAQDVLSLLSKMNKDKIRRTRAFYEAVLPRIEQPQVLQQLLSEMKNELGIRTTTNIYHTLLTRTRKAEDATKLVEIMDRDGIPKTQEIYKMLISRAQRAEDVTRLVEAMERDGIPKQRDVYHTLLNRAQTAEDVTELLEEMERDGIKKPKGAYLKLLNRAQTAEDVTKLVGEMERDGIPKQPDVYHTLLNRAQTAEDVTKRLEEMERDGIAKTKEIYHMLLCKAQTADEVTELVEKMERAGISKTKETYRVLVSRARRAEDVTKLLEEMERDGIEPKVRFCQYALMKKAHTAEDVEKLTKQIEKDGFQKTAAVYAVLISRAQTAEDVIKLVEELEKDGGSVVIRREMQKSTISGAHSLLVSKRLTAEDLKKVSEKMEGGLTSRPGGVSEVFITTTASQREEGKLQLFEGIDMTRLTQWFDQRTDIFRRRTSRENGAGKVLAKTTPETEGTIANNPQLTRQTRSGIREPGSRSPSRENCAQKAENTGSAGDTTNLPESGENPKEETAGNAAEVDFRAGHPKMSVYSCEETPKNVLLLARCSLRDPECGAIMGCGAWKPQTVVEFSWDSAVRFADGIWHKPGVLTDVSKLEFSQNGMSDRFVNIRKQRDPKLPRLVVETTEDIQQGKAFMVNDRILENPTSKPFLCPQLAFQYRDDEIPPIQVFRRYGKWHSVDTRRVQAIRDSGIAEYVSSPWAEVPARLRRNFVWKENVALGILVEIVDGEHNRERFDKGRAKLRELQRKTDSHH